MWTARSKELSVDRGIQVAIDFCSQPATVADVLRGWQADGGFRTLFNSLLAEAPYTAFRLETPPVTAASLCQAFELLDCPSLARRPDQAAFAEHFGQGVEGVGKSFLGCESSFFQVAELLDHLHLVQEAVVAQPSKKVPDTFVRPLMQISSRTNLRRRIRSVGSPEKPGWAMPINSRWSGLEKKQTKINAPTFCGQY